MTEQFGKSSKKDYTIFIRNIPYETDRDQLRDFLEQTLSNTSDTNDDGNSNSASSLPSWMVSQKQSKRIKSVHIAKDADTGQSRGYAFVEFYMALAAKEAVKKINGAVLEGKKLHAMTQDERRKNRSSGQGSDGDADDGSSKTAVKEVVVRGLPRKYDIKKTEQLLRAKFSSVGVIVNVRIPADKSRPVNAKRGGRKDVAPENARHMGYAFIQFKRAKSAQFAVIHHNDKPLHKGDRSALTVDLKLKREEYLAISEKIKDVIQQKAMQGDDDIDDSGDNTNNNSKKKKTGKSKAANDDDDSDDSDEFDLDEFDDIDLGDDFKIKNDLDDDFDNDEDDDEDEEDDIDEEEEEDEEDTKKKKGAQEHLRDVRNTVFMSNLSFDVDYEELLTLFQNRYGPVLYLSLVKNRKTNLCRGSAFLRFRQKASYDKLMQDLRTAERLMELELQSDPAMHRAAARRPVIPDLSIDGRSIHIQPALPRDEMDRKKSRDEMDRLKQKDRRNLKLADVGISALDDENFSDDVKKRVRLSFRQKRKLLKDKNHIFVSPVRLCVHFIPGSLSSNKMRQMFMDAVLKNENVVAKHGKPRIVQCKIVREDSARKNAMRFGFVEFTVHEHALCALEAINGKAGILSPSAKGKRRNQRTNRLFCEFALSDVFKLKRLEKSKQIGASNTQKQKEEAQKAKEEEQDSETMEDISDDDEDEETVGEYDKVFRGDDDDDDEEEEEEEKEEQIKSKTEKKDAKKGKAWSRSKKNRKRKMQTDETVDITENEEEKEEHKSKRQLTPPAKSESENTVSQQPRKKRRKFFSKSSDPKNSS